jgi:hemerythrin-like metal-binding protein
MGASEGLVQWEESYRLGLNEIDEQHKVLFDIMNELWMAIVRRAGNTEMLGIVNELERYTVSHFSEEERFMQSMNYSSYQTHCAQHAHFVERIHAARQSLLDGKQIDLELLHFLRDWLVHHIGSEDRAYSAEFQDGRHGLASLGRFFRRLLR